MPFTFYDTIRVVLASVAGRTPEIAGVAVCIDIVVCDPVFRRFVGGGLMSRLMLIRLQHAIVTGTKAALQKHERQAHMGHSKVG